MDNILVSVIIPVYNTEKYLSKCIESIINQTYKNIEIILVDDGSTDRSGEICEKYAETDNRIMVIHKENGGQNSARREGVRKSCGEYTMFVDSDDWIDKNMIEELLKLAIKNDSDIAVSGHIIEKTGISSKVYNNIQEGVYTDEKLKYFFKNMIYNQSNQKFGIFGSLCTKLIRKAIVKNILEKVSNDLKYHEDSAVLYCCFMDSKCITVINNCYYHYFIRYNSTIHSICGNYMWQLNEWYLFVKNHAINAGYYECVKRQMEYYILEHFFYGINSYMGFDKSVILPNYLIPDYIVPTNSNIVLYGAGSVGQSIHKQIISEKRLNIVLWVDKNYEKYRNDGLNVQSISEINKAEFDYIIICVLHEDMFKQIQENLENEYGIAENKIKWAEPQSFLDKYTNLSGIL